MNEITKISEKYLKEFLKICSEKKIKPIIVGGWAVYSYAKQQKSVDIDVVLNNKKELKEIESYFKKNEFIKDSTGLSFEKQIHKKGLTEYQLKHIIFDFFLLNEKSKLSSNKKKFLSWSLVKEFNQKNKIGKNNFFVPTIELLLIQKTKALIDREYNKIKLFSFSKKLRRKRMEFKIEKDKKDIQDLINKGINQKKFEEILIKTNLKKEIKEKLKELIK